MPHPKEFHNLIRYNCPISRNRRKIYSHKNSLGSGTTEHEARRNINIWNKALTWSYYTELKLYRPLTRLIQPHRLWTHSFFSFSGKTREWYGHLSLGRYSLPSTPHCSSTHCITVRSAGLGWPKWLKYNHLNGFTVDRNLAQPSPSTAELM